MANWEAHTPALLVKIEALDGPIDTHQSTREKVGEIYRLTPDHLSFVCAHCDEEFPLLIQFTAHIQSHLIQIHSDYIEPKGSPSAEYDADFDDGGVCHESEADEDQHIDQRPIVIEPSGPVHFVDNERDCTGAESQGSPSQSFECYLCRAPFKSNVTCKRHVREAHTSAKWQCQYCGEHINRKVAHHKKVCGPMNAFKCEHCPFNFGGEVQLSSHLRKDHGIKSEKINYRCRCCKEVLHDRANWEQHMKNSHPDELIKSHRCDSCGQTFVDQAAKACHMRSHTKHLQCDECGRQFSKQAHLTVHKYSHSDVARFKCDECPKAYKHKTGLDTHKLSHRGIRAHKCELCTKAFLMKAELKRHLWRKHRITNDEKKMSEKFVCSFCNKEYSNASNLKYHMRRHTGVKLLQCSQCDFKCPTQYDLDRHMSTHSDRRDFQCDICPRAFKQKDALVAHQRIHMGDFKFTCKWCNKGFYDKRIYEKHTRAAHEGQWDDAITGGDVITGIQLNA